MLLPPCHSSLIVFEESLLLIKCNIWWGCNHTYKVSLASRIKIDTVRVQIYQVVRHKLECEFRKTHFIVVTQHFYLFCLRLVWKLRFNLLTTFEMEKKKWFCSFIQSSSNILTFRVPRSQFLVNFWFSFSTFVAAIQPVAHILHLNYRVSSYWLLSIPDIWVVIMRQQSIASTKTSQNQFTLKLK